jgi:hypothetical protein
VQVLPWYALSRSFCIVVAQNNGMAQICAIVSLLTGKCVPPTTAMTGEVRNLPPSFTRIAFFFFDVLLVLDHAPRTGLGGWGYQGEGVGLTSGRRE